MGEVAVEGIFAAGNAEIMKYNFNDMAKKIIKKEWRELEILVEKIERAISPATTIIKSPNFLTDKVTGEKREVDVSLQFTIGSTNILMVVECRNRNKPQDVRWVEEITTKRNDLGVSKVIAVSKKGFSEQAIKKAKFYNVELRTFDEIDEDVIKEWNDLLIVEEISINYRLISLEYKFNDQYENATNLISWKEGIFKTPIIKLNDKSYTLEEFISTKKLVGIINESKEKQLTIKLKFNKQCFIKTNYGDLAASEMEVRIIGCMEKKQLNTRNIIRYRDIITNKIDEIGYYNLNEIAESNITIEAYKQHVSNLYNHEK